MALIPRDVFQSLMPFKGESLLREMLSNVPRSFDESRFFSDGLMPRSLESGWGGFSPAMSVRETDTEFKITAELPGIDPGDVDVSVNGNMLTLKGEKKVEKEDKDSQGVRSERMYGAFQRVVSLPVKVNPEKVEAHYKNGVLWISLKKADEAIQQARKIPIKLESRN